MGNLNTQNKIINSSQIKIIESKEISSRDIWNLILSRWLAISSVWFLGTLIWEVCPLFNSLINGDTKNLLWNCSFVYFFLGLIWEAGFAFFFKENYLNTKSNSVEFFKFIFEAIKNYKSTNWSKLSQETKFSILFLALRTFYLPLMLNTVVIQFTTIKFATGYSAILLQLSDPNWTVKIFYFLDVLPFAVAYLFNFGNFRTQSVDTTFAGWFFCLICYPPFNDGMSQIFPFHHNDFGGWWGWIALGLFSVYVWASWALGLRSGHLQYRGLCNSGPYAFVRHPAYSFKAMSWVVGTIAWTIAQISFLPDIKSMFMVIGWNLLSSLMWLWVYHQRAISEEKHLERYAEYNEYCKKVKYRYIPFVI